MRATIMAALDSIDTEQEGRKEGNLLSNGMVHEQARYTRHLPDLFGGSNMKWQAARRLSTQ